MTAKLTSIDAASFDRLANLTKLGSDAREMARRVLVEATPMTDVAQQFNSSRQRVNLAVNSIRRVYEQGHDEVASDAWVTLDLALPQRLLVGLEALAKGLRASPSPQASQRALAHVEDALEHARRTLGVGGGRKTKCDGNPS